MNGQIIKLIKNINISNIASSTSKTLNIIKKIIPVYKEIKPFATKEKSIFKKEEELITEKKELSEYDNSITFFQ